MGGWMEQAAEEMFLAGLPLANLTHIVAELSFLPGNHLTLIKEGRGDSGEKKDGSVFHPGKKLYGQIKGQPGVILPSVRPGRRRFGKREIK